MTYEVFYRHNGRLVLAEIDAMTDAQAMSVALAALPANAELVDVDLPEAA